MVHDDDKDGIRVEKEDDHHVLHSADVHRVARRHGHDRDRRRVLQWTLSW